MKTKQLMMGIALTALCFSVSVNAKNVIKENKIATHFNFEAEAYLYSINSLQKFIIGSLYSGIL